MRLPRIHTCVALEFLLASGCGTSTDVAASGNGDGQGDAAIIFGNPSGHNGPWINRTPRPVPSGWPPIGGNIPLVYDGARGKVMMFGGGTSLGFSESHELYEWNGDEGQWHALTPSPLPALWPAERGGHALAWDSKRKKLVVFGGYDLQAPTITIPQADIWELDSATLTWTDRTPATLPAAWPAPRFLHAMVYDGARDKIVLFGGWGKNFEVFGDLWEWDADTGTWTNPTPSPAPSSWPMPRYSHAMVYDPTRSRTVMFAGYINGPLTNELWEWDGTTMTNRTPSTIPKSWPAVRTEHAVTFDPFRGVMIVFGGYYPIMGDTWEWESATNVWTLGEPTGPSPRRDATMAFDERRRRAVLFGGEDVELAPPLHDTWEYSVTGNMVRDAAVH